MAVEIQVGQVWRSRDSRDDGRTVTVLETCGPHDNGFVVVQSFRKSSIRRANFPKQYELVREAPGASR